VNDINPITFSVIIPLYNRAHTIKQAIDSVLQQTYQNFEIIIVDDGSNDNPAAVIQSVQDNRLRYLKQDNKGAASARNAGILNAHGQYIAFLDSDDVWLPHHLGQILSILNENPNVCVYGQIIVDRGNGISFVKPPRGMKENEDISEYLLCDRGFIPTISLVMPIEIAKRTLYDEKMVYGDDVDLGIKIAKAGSKLHFNSGRPSAVWNDNSDTGRLSGYIAPHLIEDWLLRIQHDITAKALKGCKGWTVAKGYAEQGQWIKAITLYTQALISGCYSPKMSIVVLLQIIFPRHVYRKFSDFIARLGIKP
jgi:glycosyltransferase involved in cell wall biosynthesis